MITQEQAARIIQGQEQIMSMLQQTLKAKSNLISFKEIIAERGISQDTLTRWVKECGFTTYRIKGGQKAIRLKDYNRLP